MRIKRRIAKERSSQQNLSLDTAINSSISPIESQMKQKIAMLICIMLFYLIDLPGIESSSSAVVTLEAIQIHNSHEWLKTSKPDVYFSCLGENKTFLPDVKLVNVSYSFNGEESWQPLTQFTSKKCKRCGFYEKDTFQSDDVFEEWEFCPSDFESSNGRYVRHKTNEFDVSFLCPLCLYFPADPINIAASSPQKGKGTHIFVVILICVVVSTVLVLGVLVLHKYWQKRKREQDQARFLKLFEDGDDIEDELGLDLEM